MGVFIVEQDAPRAADVQALLADHLAFARQHPPPEDVRALDLARLTAANVSLFSVRQDGELLGVGALQQPDELYVEFNSMHTAEAARGRGVGRALVDHLARHRCGSSPTSSGSAMSGCQSFACWTAPWRLSDPLHRAPPLPTEG